MGIIKKNLFSLFLSHQHNLKTKLNAGDKDGDCEHEMKIVTRGARVAVGLLQPLTDAILNNAG